MERKINMRKVLKAQHARKQRNLIKTQLRTVLKDVESISPKKGTDYLIIKLIEHALRWKTFYNSYNVDKCNNVNEKLTQDDNVITKEHSNETFIQKEYMQDLIMNLSIYSMYL